MDEATDMAKADIWMPLYIGDYLADTMHLTTEQHGAYLLLIMAYWKNGGAISSDDSRLAATCRLSLDAWSMHKHTLASFFDTWSDPSLWILVRAEKEMEKAGNNQEKRTLRAQKAAAARWGSDAPSNAPSNAPSIQQAMLNECPSPSPSHKDQKHIPPTPKAAKEKPIILTLEDLVSFGVDRQHAIDWLVVRKQKKAALTPTAWKRMVTEAGKAGITPAQAVQIAAEKSWQAFDSSYNWRASNGFQQAQRQGSGTARLSLVDQVRLRNEQRAAERSRAAGSQTAPDGQLFAAGVESGGCYDGEFARIRDTDGKIVGADD